MLRRRTDNTWEFRQLELALVAIAPAAFRPDRREALRLRLMAALGQQEGPRALLTPILRERWVAIPAGIGLAAAIIAANRLLIDSGNQPADGPVTAATYAMGQVLVNGSPGTGFGPGDRLEARSSAWLAVGDSAGVGLETGSMVRFIGGGNGFVFAMERGQATFASGTATVTVSGGSWTAALRPGTVASFALINEGVVVTVYEGEAEVTYGGHTHRVQPGNPQVFAGDGHPAANAGESEASGSPGSEPTTTTRTGESGSPASEGPASGHGVETGGNPAGGPTGAGGHANENANPNPPGNNAGGNANENANPSPLGNNAGGNANENANPSPPGNNAGGLGNENANPSPPRNNAGGLGNENANPSPGNNPAGNGSGNGNPSPPGNSAGGPGNPDPPANGAGGNGKAKNPK